MYPCHFKTCLLLSQPPQFVCSCFTSTPCRAVVLSFCLCVCVRACVSVFVLLIGLIAVLLGCMFVVGCLFFADWSSASLSLLPCSVFPSGLLCS